MPPAEFFQTPPLLGNQYAEDRPLQSMLRRALPSEVLHDIEPSLRSMGELAAGPLLALTQKHRLDVPQHVPYDAWGERLDEVTVPTSWEEFARVAARTGLVATA